MLMLYSALGTKPAYHRVCTADGFVGIMQPTASYLLLSGKSSQSGQNTAGWNGIYRESCLGAAFNERHLYSKQEL